MLFTGVVSGSERQCVGKVFEMLTGNPPKTDT